MSSARHVAIDRASVFLELGSLIIFVLPTRDTTLITTVRSLRFEPSDSGHALVGISTLLVVVGSRFSIAPIAHLLRLYLRIITALHFAARSRLCLDWLGHSRCVSLVKRVFAVNFKLLLVLVCRGNLFTRRILFSTTAWAFLI